MDADFYALLAASQDPQTTDERIVEIVVHSCAFSCCGHGWRRRDGYEQIYRGWVNNLDAAGPDDEHGTFMLYTLGLGQISAVIAARFGEVLDVHRPALVP